MALYGSHYCTVDIKSLLVQFCLNIISWYLMWLVINLWTTSWRDSCGYCIFCYSQVISFFFHFLENVVCSSFWVCLDWFIVLFYMYRHISHVQTHLNQMNYNLKLYILFKVAVWDTAHVQLVVVLNICRTPKSSYRYKCYNTD